MKYVRYFDDASEIGNGIDIDLPSVVYLNGKNVLYAENGKDKKALIQVNNQGEVYETYYSTMPLTFEAIESGTFKFTYATQYSINNGTTWVNLTPNTNTPTIAAGNKIMWKATLVPSSSTGIGKFSATGNFNAYGNIMSLLYGDNFIGQTDLTGKNYVFRYLFKNNTKIVNTKNLILPATTLANYCYYCMFDGCTSLTTAPELPATTLANYCYQYMFDGCTSLTTAPELPATTLASNCYSSMFYGCINLTTTPELPATTLASNCYSNMFNRCTSLTTAPELSIITLAEGCYGAMFAACTSLTTAPELPATTLSAHCYESMFDGCTSLTTTPELPATTLAESCYSHMFNRCTSLTTAPELPVTTLAESCYSYMFAACTSLTTAPELPATTLTGSCYRGMFQGCTSLITAPELPATTLVDYCYYYMFYDCINLNHIKAMFTTTPSTTYTPNWVSGVSSTGTFVKNSAATWDVTGNDGVPSGWTVQTASS